MALKRNINLFSVIDYILLYMIKLDDEFCANENFNGVSAVF